MALSASLSLDIKSFQAGLDRAEVELQTFERATKSVNRDLKRLMEDFSGQKIAVEAERMAEAVKRLGGASKLTENEQRRVNTAVTEALAKYRALGQEAPAHLVALQTATAGTTTKTSALVGAVGQMAAAFSVAALVQRAASALISFGAAALRSAGELTDLRAATGVSLGMLQRWGHVAEQGGVQLEDMTKASFKLGVALDGGSGSVREAVSRLNLSFESLRAMKPEDQLDTILRAADALGPSQERNAVLVDLFGANGAVALAKVSDGYAGVADEASRSADQQIEALDRAGDAWARLLRNAGTLATSASGTLALWAEDLLAAVKLTTDGLDRFNSVQKIVIAQILNNGGEGLAEFIRKIDEAQQSSTNAIGQQSSTTTNYVQALTAMRAEIAEVVKAHGTQLEAAIKLGVSQEEIERRFGLSAEAQRLYSSMTKDATAATKAGTTEATRRAEAEDRSQKQFRDSIKFLDMYKGGYMAVTNAIEDNRAAINDVRQSMEAMSRITFNNNFVPFTAAVKQLSSGAMPKLKTEVKNTEDALGDLSSALADFAQISGGKTLDSLSKIVGGMAAAAKATKTFTDALDGWKTTKTVSGLIQMSGAVLTLVSSLKQMASASKDGSFEQLGTIIAGAQAGMKIGGAIAPGIGTAIGGFLGAVSGFVANMVFAQKKVQEISNLLKEWPDIIATSTTNTGFLRNNLGETLREMVRLGRATQAVKDYVADLASLITEGFNGVVLGVVRWEAVGDAVRTAQKNIDDLNKTDLKDRGTEWILKMATAQKALTAALEEQYAAAASARSSLADLGTQALATFNAAMASGLTFSQALTKIQPGIQALIKAYADLGIPIEDAGLKFLATVSQIVAGNPALIAGVDALAQSVKALTNLGMLDPATFSAMQRTAIDMFTRIAAEVEKAGLTGEEAARATLLPMQQYLRDAAEAAKRLGIPLSEDTQKMIDQSKALGIWQDNSETMIDVLVDMRSAIRELVDALKGIPRKTTTEIETRYTTTGAPPDPDPDPDRDGKRRGFAHGSGGIKDFGRGTPAVLHGRERVQTEAQMHAEQKSLVNSGAASRVTTPIVTSGTIVVPLYMDGKQIAEATVPYIPAALSRRGV
jgi:hypothetical protein